MRRPSVPGTSAATPGGNESESFSVWLPYGVAANSRPEHDSSEPLVAPVL